MRQRVTALSMVIAMSVLMLSTALPAHAFTNACGTGDHTGNTTTDEASAWWNSVNDPDCWVQVAAKCAVGVGGAGATWYWGSKKYIGSTSVYDCDWNSTQRELYTWGYGWGPQ